MLRLQSRVLQREFKVYEENLFASQIRNVVSGMDFVPDGNSVEFLFHFTDGSEFTSKGLKVTEQKQEASKLSFTFAQTQGITVTLSFWTGDDGNTLKKQISFIQNGDKVVDYVLLEHIGIINSKTHFSVPEVEGIELNALHSSLGQPFYIDSLFFGCEFPATQNTILFGIGQVKYFIGHHIDGKFECPVTIVGGAKSNQMVDVQKAFFNYIDSIATPSHFRIQFNSWYDHMLGIDADNIEKSFMEIEKYLSSNGIEPIDAYVVDDGWNDYKSSFWSFNKKFPNRFYDSSELANRLGSSFGMWLGPRGGYNFQTKKFAKRIEKKGNGAYNAQSQDICVADKIYLQNLESFLLKVSKEFDINYWKFDGFCLSPCQNSKHDHIVGGENDMYFVTQMWERWIELFKKLRLSRKKQGKDVWINMTCYVNPSPWWLQYVNSIWLQKSNDIGFADNIDHQPQLEREITYRDSRYYDFLCTRAQQFPVKNIYNHEPIYGNHAKVKYTDEEFEKYLYFNACRGSALNELHLSYTMMNKSKWRILANVLKWQKSNYDILQNVSFLGGKPDENNIYGYFGWNEKGDGIIALRNPTDEKTSLTLTLNKLMGCPEDLSDVRRYNVYNEGASENFDSFSYGDKIEMTLKPFEVKIFQFGKEDRRYDYVSGATEFTISFSYNGEENIEIAQNEDIKIAVEKGYVYVKCGKCHLRSKSIITSNKHSITIVREKNRMLKIYIDSHLDSSGFDRRAKTKISTAISSAANGFKVITKATPYDEIKKIQISK